MKKDRNSFFSQYGYSAFNAPAPMATPTNQNMSNFTGYDPSSELDARISKLEREIQRLDYRLSKLEGTTNASTNINSTDYNFTNSMYMV